MIPKDTVIFDLDGTLVRCHEYYEAAKQEGAEFIAHHTEVPLTAARRLIETMEFTAKEALHYAFDRGRFPASFRIAMEAAYAITGRIPNYERVNEVGQIGDSVFDAAYELLDGAEEAIMAAKEYSKQLVLFTKGDAQVQQSKIDRHPVIRDNFRAFHIVPKKSPQVLMEVIIREDIAPATSWMVGDSIPDDMYPAKINGLKTVHVKAPGPEWDVRLSVTPRYTIESIAGLPVILRSEHFAASVLSG